jgi:CMP-N-acetylneuraminic acid synthetase
MEDFVIVVPAKKSNRHFKDGDLQLISGQSLVTWKLNQISNLIYKYRTILLVDEYLELESKFHGKIEQVIRGGESIYDLKKQINGLLNGENVVWLNCNLPFLNENSIEKAIEIVKSDTNTYDSLTSVSIAKDFFVYKGNPLNFNPKEEMIRNMVEPLTRLNNAIYIFNSSSQNMSLLGFNVCYFEIPDTEAFELKSSYDESEIKLRFVNFLLLKPEIT